MQYRSNINQDYIVNNILTPKTPKIKDYIFRMRKNVGKKGIDEYNIYNNHSFMEVKQL